MAKGYFMFTVSEDGDVSIEGPLTGEVLQTRLREHSDGIEFATECPGDTNYFGNKVLLIKGEIVVPEPVQVVTKLKIP